MLWVTSSTVCKGSFWLDPEIEEIGPQGLGGQDVQRGEGLVHEERDRICHDRARKAHALAHAARELARIGDLKPIEPDQIDGSLGPPAHFGARQPQRIEARLTFSLTVSQGYRAKALEYHGDAFGRSAQRLPRDRAPLPMWA